MKPPEGNEMAKESMDSADREFLELLKSAVRQSISELTHQRAGESLVGYALVTDDGLGTLRHQAITREALQASGDSDLMFSPTDWPYETAKDAFDGVATSLRRRAENASDLKAHVDSSFSLFVLALDELKREELFGPGVFLTVLSSDPSEYLENLEAVAIERLNGSAVVRARELFLQKWS
jgi:Domain of unknown function (DUF4303)